MNEPALLCITDAAKQFGVSSKTLRYYESVGLIRAVRQEDNRYRYYDAENTERIRGILVLRKMQIPVRDILRIYETEDLRTAAEVFVERIETIDREIGALTEMKRITDEFLETMRESGIRKISALPLLYDEMNERLSASPGAGAVTSPGVKELSSSGIHPMDAGTVPQSRVQEACAVHEPVLRILSLPRGKAVLSTTSDGGNDPAALHRYLFSHGITDILPAWGEPGSHTVFERWPASDGTSADMSDADDSPRTMVLCPDGFDIPGCPFVVRPFSGGLFAAASVCADDDLPQFLYRMTEMITENRYYEQDTSGGVLREDILTEALISPDPAREMFDVLLPIRCRTPDTSGWRQTSPVHTPIPADSLSAENPVLSRIPVRLREMQYTGMRKTGEGEDSYDYRFYSYNDAGGIELHSYLLPRRLISRERVRIPCAAELAVTVWAPGMETELLYRSGRLHIRIEEDSLTVTLSDPVFGHASAENAVRRTCPLPASFAYGRECVWYWLIGERHCAFVLGGETVVCCTDMTYMQMDCATHTAEPLKLSAANGFDRITVSEITLCSMEPHPKSNVRKGDLCMIQRPHNNILPNIHPLCTWHFGENYPFNACMKHLMEYVEPDPLYTYNFFGGISGDNFVQVYGRDYSRYSDCVSVVTNGAAFCGRVFDAIGYSHTYVMAEQICANKFLYLETLKAYIDRGIPVLRRGTQKGCDVGNYSLIVGYEENGRILLYLDGDAAEPFRLNTDADFYEDWIFIGTKTQEIPLPDLYRNAFVNVRRLLTLPEQYRCVFGPAAFRAWADDIENGRFDSVTPETFDEWRDYTIYVCNFSTNFCGCPRDFLSKAAECVPAFAEIRDTYLAMGDRNERELCARLQQLGGNFNVTLDNLKDKETRHAIADVIREYAVMYEAFVRVLDRVLG